MFPFFPASFPWIFPPPGGPCLHFALLAWPAAGTKTLWHIGNWSNDKKSIILRVAYQILLGRCLCIVVTIYIYDFSRIFLFYYSIFLCSYLAMSNVKVWRTSLFYYLARQNRPFLGVSKLVVGFYWIRTQYFTWQIVRSYSNQQRGYIQISTNHDFGEFTNRWYIAGFHKQIITPGRTWYNIFV